MTRTLGIASSPLRRRSSCASASRQCGSSIPERARALEAEHAVGGSRRGPRHLARSGSARRRPAGTARAARPARRSRARSRTSEAMPSQARWSVPRAPAATAAKSPRASGAVQVGRPSWSSTTRSGAPFVRGAAGWCARSSGPAPNTHWVRTIRCSPPARAHALARPRSLVRPYTESGRVGASSGIGARGRGRRTRSRCDRWTSSAPAAAGLREHAPGARAFTRSAASRLASRSGRPQ